MKSQRNLQAQLKTAQADTRPKFLIELAKPTKKRISKFFFPSLKKLKYATAQPDTTKTEKRSIDNGLQGRATRTTGTNSGLAKVALQFFD